MSEEELSRKTFKIESFVQTEEYNNVSKKKQKSLNLIQCLVGVDK